MARLHLRDEGMESVGIVVGSERIRVRLDPEERSVMSERDAKEGVSVGTRESRKVMQCCMDLHAARRFTAAASVDGSLKESLAHGRVRRRAAANEISFAAARRRTRLRSPPPGGERESTVFILK